MLLVSMDSWYKHLKNVLIFISWWEKGDITKALAYIIVQEHLPISHVDSDGFRIFCKDGAPDTSHQEELG